VVVVPVHDDDVDGALLELLSGTDTAEAAAEDEDAGPPFPHAVASACRHLFNARRPLPSAGHPNGMNLASLRENAC
jgi:hypothetical protein